jgi:ubiquinone/menaquinone biosynthesis C-methylase UbiE
MNQQLKDQVDQQRKTWNTYSKGWKKWDDILTKSMSPISEKMIEPLHLDGTEKILDVASGTGEPGITLSKLLKHGTVNAIDLSEKMVAIANERAKDSGCVNYNSQVAESSKIPFGDSHFDGIICRFGVMFFPDLKSSLKEFARVLKPGGSLVLAVWATPDKNPFITLMSMSVIEKLNLPRPLPDAPGIFRFAKPGLLKEIVTDAAFKEVSELTVSGEIVYDSPEHYWELTSDVAGPVMEPLKSATAEVVEDIKKAVLDKVASQARNGKVPVRWEAIIVKGRKAG